MVYDPYLPFYYNNNQQFLQKHLPANIFKTTKIFEKAEIRWICANDIPKKRSQFRFFFREIADMIFQQRENIEAFVIKGLKTHKKTRSNRRKQRKTKKRIT